MQTILSKLSNQKAQEELKKFATLSLVLSAISLIILWWLAIVGLAFGARALLLTYHKGNKNRKDLIKLRVMSILVIVLALISIIWFNLSS